MLPPEDFDFPCSYAWRCFYSGEPYLPDAEEIRRHQQQQNDKVVMGRSPHEEDPFKAVLKATGINLAPWGSNKPWFRIVLKGERIRGLRPLDE